MLGNGGAYAGKRRKKPVPKTAKLPPVKTSPSKRHRDRLNLELDHLTSLLPLSEEVRGRLDKLSVLRLTVGYLRVKNYFHAVLQKNAKSAPLTCTNDRNGQSVNGVSFSEGEFLLQALNGFVLVVTDDGTIFYTSTTIQDFLGYHQSDVVHQSVYELVHIDDREMFKCQLHFALNPSETDSDSGVEDAQSISKASSSCQRLLPQHIPPENSSFLERSFCCRLRCLLDNTSGFLALNFTGRLKYLHSQGNDRADGNVSPPQLALFAIAAPVQPPSVMEIRTKTLLFQTKHKMDFAPMSIDTRAKLVLGYTETELVTTGSGYQFIHAADIMYCADYHLRMIKTGESGFAIFRLLTKTRQWLWVQASARVVFKGGRPDFIIARQKALTNEEGEEHLRQRRQQLPFNLATGEGVLYDMSVDVFSAPGSPGSGASGVDQHTEKPLDPASLLGSLHRQDLSLYTHPQDPSPQLQNFSQTEDADFEQPQSSMEQAFLDSHALLSVPGQTQTSQKRPFTGDLTTEAMIGSLEQILEDARDGGLEGLEVGETELNEWENTLVRVNKEREGTSSEVNHILANDVFSYVEEALRREFGGYVQGSDQPLVLETISSLSTQGQHAEFSNHELHWQQVMHVQSNRGGFEEQAKLGNILGVGNLTELNVVSHTAAQTLRPTQNCNTHQRQTSSLWSNSSSNHQPGSQMISTGLAHIARTTTHSPQFTMSHPGIVQSSSPSAHMAVCADVGNISSGHLSGDNIGPGATPSDYGPENGQSSFSCLNREAQIPLNSIILPTQSINVSHNVVP